MSTTISENSAISENVKVYCRPRLDPLNKTGLERSDDAENSVRILSNGSCQYLANKNDQTFRFDGCFSENVSQEEIFRTVAQPLVSSVIRGYSGAILAYGCTGAGKTFTMRGNESRESKGIMPRCIDGILGGIDSGTEVWISFVQIYCETLTDLLNPPTSYSGGNGFSVPTGAGLDSSSNQLFIREKSNGTIYVEGLSKARITNISDFYELLEKGDSCRFTAATNSNETSSRSHAALIITLISDNNNNQNSSSKSSSSSTINSRRESSLVLVDLAGSERASASSGRNYMRAEEAKAINLSLSALGNCMHALSEGKKHVPFRDSKLTRLLQFCLGGGARLSIIVNINSGLDVHGETLNTLRFASRAAKVKIVAKVSRYVDYECLYNEARAKYDILEQRQRTKEGEISEKMEVIEAKQYEIDTLKEQEASLSSQVKMLKQQLLSSQNNNNNSSNEKTLKTTSDNIETSDNQISSMSMKFEEEVKSLKQRYEAKIRQLEKNGSEMTLEISELQFDIQEAREKHLFSLKDMRILQEKNINLESESNNRIDELLAELQEQNAEIEELKEKLLTASEHITNQQNQISEAAEVIEGMVSKSKLDEMETLFLETVTRLSQRVQHLEKPAGGGKRPSFSDTEDNCYGPNDADIGNGNGNSNSNGLPPLPYATGGASNAAAATKLINGKRIEPGGRIRSSNTNSSNMNQSNSTSSILNGQGKSKLW